MSQKKWAPRPTTNREKIIAALKGEGGRKSAYEISWATGIPWGSCLKILIKLVQQGKADAIKKRPAGELLFAKVNEEEKP